MLHRRRGNCFLPVFDGRRRSFCVSVSQKFLLAIFFRQSHLFISEMMPPQIISSKGGAVSSRVGPLFQHHHEPFHLDVERVCEQSQKTHRMLTGGHHSKSCSPAQHTRTLFFMAGGRTLMCTDKWTEWSNGRLLFPHFMGL